MAQAKMTRAYALGLGFGTVWLVITCLGFGILDAVNITVTSVSTLFAIVGVVLISGILLYLCIRFLRLGYMLPKTNEGRTSVTGLRLFGLLILLEIIGWTLLNIVLVQHHQHVWVIPIDLIIVGIHFIPLAFVFHVRPYLFMGIFWLIAIIGSMILWPSPTIIGHTSAWVTLPSIGCIAITWLTVLYLMTAEMKRLREVV